MSHRKLNGKVNFPVITWEGGAEPHIQTNHPCVYLLHWITCWDHRAMCRYLTSTFVYIPQNFVFFLNIDSTPHPSWFYSCQLSLYFLIFLKMESSRVLLDAFLFFSPRDASKQEHTNTCNRKQTADPTKASDNSFNIQIVWGIISGKVSDPNTLLHLCHWPQGLNHSHLVKYHIKSPGYSSSQKLTNIGLE